MITLYALATLICISWSSFVVATIAIVHYGVVGKEVKGLNIVHVNDHPLVMCRASTYTHWCIVTRTSVCSAEPVLIIECAIRPANYVLFVTLPSSIAKSGSAVPHSSPLVC